MMEYTMKKIVCLFALVTLACPAFAHPSAYPHVHMHQGWINLGVLASFAVVMQVMRFAARIREQVRAKSRK